jgi:hypothetical protein
MTRWTILIVLGVGAAVAGVVWYVHPPGKPRGYAGVQFSTTTRAAAHRAPLLKTPGALVQVVEDSSPAAGAGLAVGQVVAAIDGVPVTSAAQAAGIVRSHREGDSVLFTVFDEPHGEIEPRDILLVFAGEPPLSNKHSVKPPRTLADQVFQRPGMAANAAWSRKIARGAFIRPLELRGLGKGQCNGFAPEGWFVAAHADDNSMLHVMAPSGFQHAVFETAALNGRDPQGFVEELIAENFQAPPTVAALEPQPYGFTLVKFGTPKGAAGFAEYRVTGNRIAVWLVAVAAADAGWALPQTGAVVFSLHCAASDTQPLQLRDKGLVDTAVSTRCLDGKCGEGDFAAAYMRVLKLGYVHSPKGINYLVKPKSDFWQNGAQGPGYYHQIGGENEKLEPGRTN